MCKNCGVLRCKCKFKKKLKLNKSCESIEGITDVRVRQTLSDGNFFKNKTVPKKKWQSEPNIHYKVNYDDICGPLPKPDHPAFKQFEDDANLKPILCSWKFITVKDMKCMKKCLFDKAIVKSIIGKTYCTYLQKRRKRKN